MRLGKLLARIDARLSFAIGACAAVLMALCLSVLTAFAVLEALEEKDHEIAHAVDSALVRLTSSPPVSLHLPAGVVAEVRDDQGRVVTSAGSWPDPHRIVHVGLRAALTATQDDFLERTFPRGAETLELALPLRHFVRERGELYSAAAQLLLASLAAATVFGVLAVHRSFEPLRRATRAIRWIDSSHLDQRVPMRGTSDDVDALADAINRVFERLEWAFERMAAFTADVAHELRTPVNRMLNSAEVALLAGDAKTRDETLVVIRNTAEDMRRLIEQLILLAKGDEGRLPLRIEELDLEARMRALVSLYAPLAEESDQKLELSACSARGLGDASLLDRAVSNLLENALRHTPRGGTIRVSVSPASDGLHIVVEDSGPGLPEAVREEVFNRFVQLDPSRRSGGAGLGLSIARMIVRLHGGDLRVESSPLGGALFRILLVGNPQLAKPDGSAPVP